MMEKHDVFFVIGLFSLAVGLFLFPLSIYILPAVWFGWSYHQPTFILNWNNWLQDSFGLTGQAASWGVFGGLFIGSLVFAALAYVAATRPQEGVKPTTVHLLFEDDNQVKPLRQDKRETVFLVIKIVVIMLLVFLVAEIMQWAIAISPAT